MTNDDTARPETEAPETTEAETNEAETGTEPTALDALLARAKEQLADFDLPEGAPEAILDSITHTVESEELDPEKVELSFEETDDGMKVAIAATKVERIEGDLPDFLKDFLEGKAEGVFKKFDMGGDKPSFKDFLKAMKKPEPDPLDELRDLLTAISAMDITVETEGATLKMGSKPIMVKGGQPPIYVPVLS